MAVSHITWRGMPALQIQSDRLRVVTTPGLGAKITSLYDRVANYEWLVSPPGKPFGPVDYGAPFTSQDMSGWDDMYPSIKSCSYPVPGPYYGTPVPDHGEIWAVPWLVESIASDRVTVSVDGRALPYRFQRTMLFEDAATLTLRYAVTNTGSHPLAGLWAAHPQFTATDSTRVILPETVTEMYNARDIPAWGAYGVCYSWPQAVNQHGEVVQLDRIAPPDARTCRKLYVPPETPIEWAALAEETDAHWLLMRWDPAQIPYLGIWVDEGAANEVSTVALEVSDGFHDALPIAWENRRCPVLAPGETRKWEVSLRVGSGALDIPSTGQE